MNRARDILEARGYTDAEIDEMEENEHLQDDLADADAALAVDDPDDEDSRFDTLAEEHEFFEEARRESFE